MMNETNFSTQSTIASIVEVKTRKSSLESVETKRGEKKMDISDRKENASENVINGFGHGINLKETETEMDGLKFAEIHVIDREGINNLYSRTVSVKREKSLSDSIERKKKRVKFSTSDVINDVKKDEKQGKENRYKLELHRNANKIKEKGILKKITAYQEETTEQIFEEISHEEPIPYMGSIALSNQNPNVSLKAIMNLVNLPANQNQEPTQESPDIERQSTFTKDGAFPSPPSPSDENKNTLAILPAEDQINLENKDFKSENKVSCLAKEDKKIKDEERCPVKEDKQIKDHKHNSIKENIRTIFPRKRTSVVPEPSFLTPKIICKEDRKRSNIMRSKNDSKENAKITIKKDNLEKQGSIKKENNSVSSIPVKVYARRCLKSESPNIKNNKEPLESNANKRDSTISSTNFRSNVDKNESNKMLEEIRTLKEHHKILEEKLKEQTSRQRDYQNEKRTLIEQHEIEMSKMVRDSKREATILLSELKSKERAIINLEKTMQKQTAEFQEIKNKQHLEKDDSTKNHSSLRPTLTRSLSAAAAIGRKSRPLQLKNTKFPFQNTKKDESRLLGIRKKEELSPSGKTQEKQIPSKLNQLLQQVEEQKEEILLLHERLRDENPNLQSLSQLSASVPSICDPEKLESVPPSFCLNEPSFIQRLHYDSSTSSSTHFPGTNQSLNQIELQALFKHEAMDSQDLNSKSLDIYGRRFSSLGPPSHHSYSSYMSLDASRREIELAEENQMLRAELQETKDHAELLEFRILEFTEGIQRVTNSTQLTCDQSTCTVLDDVITAGIQHSISEDLSLPLSLDSGLELHIEFDSKSRLSDYRRSLARLEEASGLAEASSIAHLSSLIEWASSFTSAHHDNLPSIMSPRSPIQKKMGVSGDSEDSCLDDNISGADLAMLAARLQETLANPKAQEEVLEETIIKLRAVNTSLTRLQSRVSSLSSENRDLQEALAALHEAHETQTEASGTESELVHGKTPSLHSDLSDNESDDSSRPTKSSNLETTSSFQESGIFESSCEMISTATQTPRTFNSTDCNENEIMEESSTDQTSLLRSSQTSLEGEDLKKAEVDLQSALARLTSIKNVVQGRDLRNLRLQDLQESDEYLVAALEGERVTLCKIEYDSIVATERSLQREIEILQYEKEQLALQCAALEEKLQKPIKPINNDIVEVLQAKVRLLEERLEVSERLRRQFFDEKCEIEEAENDARLMAQRLESQLEAAREMEALLSASLSQEQEFCRELQRRVREMHVIDKGRRMHEEVLEKESQTCRQREAALLVANDSQKSQLTFALYGLILAQFWRRIASHNRAAVVPYMPFKHSVFENDNLISESSYAKCLSETISIPSFPCVSECKNCLRGDNLVKRGLVDVCDMCTQTPNKNLNDASVQVTRESKSVEIQCNNSEGVEGNMKFESDSENEPLRKRQRSVDKTNCVSSENDVSDGISEREQFYIAQIEVLQKERRSLREDYENGNSESLKQIQAMKFELENLQLSLEESQRDKCKILLKLEAAQTSIGESEHQLEKQIKDLKREFSRSVEAYNVEQKAIEEQYEERISEMRRINDTHEQRFSALLQQYSILQHELEPYFHGNGDSSDEYENGENNGGRISTTKDLLAAVRELIRSEAKVKQKINELEKKESAYRETINEADRIMSNHVTLYTQRIEELEASLEQKSSRIKQLEASEERLRSTMKNNWKTGEGARITELLDRLIETENSELNLKERVWNLERNGKELQIKFAEAEKAQENLRSELRDQEELVQRLMSLSSENNALTSQLQEAHEAARRASEIQQNETFLKSRMEELESSEYNLRDGLKKTEHMMMQRERKLRDQISNLEEEVSAMRAQVEIRTAEAKQVKEFEYSLRQQIDDYRGQVHVLEKDLKDSSSENICHETQHRSEVMKLRSQLKLVNSQLTDLDTLNGELKERLKVTEIAMQEVAMRLEERARRHESEVLSLNLQLGQKDSKIEEFEAQLQQLSHANVVEELDYLATSPLIQLQNSLEKIMKASKNCEECSKSQNVLLEELDDCIKTLTELINGRSSQSDTESEDYETTQAENLANETHSTTSPPNPAQEGQKENLSGEETNNVVSSPLTDSIKDNQNLGPQSTRTKILPPPRPRRDAKKKRKSRKCINKEGSLLQELEESSVERGSFYGRNPASFTILEELEEKVRELEEVLARKEEELRLADSEAADLHSRLMDEDSKLSQKTEEASQSNVALVSLREQLLTTVQEYERVRRQIEAKHKVDLSALTEKIESLSKDLLRLSKRANLKDKIIDTLVRQIRSILRSGNMGVVMNQIRQINENSSKTESEQDGEAFEEEEVIDFDVESVCYLMDQPDENL